MRIALHTLIRVHVYRFASLRSLADKKVFAVMKNKMIESECSNSIVKEFLI